MPVPPDSLLFSSFRCPLWAMLFPPVPAPKNHIKDFIVTMNYEVTLTLLPVRPLCPGLGPRVLPSGSWSHVTRWGLRPGTQGLFCHPALGLIVSLCIGKVLLSFKCPLQPDLNLNFLSAIS